jgi:isoquinoline 1-oxidoreductase alpha subunit
MMQKMFKEALAMLKLRVNRKNYSVDVSPDTPLLWVLRDSLGLTGTKFGCGIEECGACTVHINGESARSCVIPVSSVVGKEVTTIEGIASELGNILQQAWLEEDVPQCGYCQPGQIMTAAELLRDNPNPSDEDINNAMSGNICRCGTYQRIRRAIHLAARIKQKGGRK